jgi:single-strand DNA-binding protein
MASGKKGRNDTMNKVILIGRLVADPELRHTQSGTAVCRYRMAVDRPFKKEGQQNVDFLNCLTWNKNAEFASRYLRKGTKIAVEGHIKTDSFEKDGVKRYTFEIEVERQEFCESKAAADPGSGYSAPADSYPGTDQQFTDMDDDGFECPF